MVNCMAKIAECLGVELNEVFRIEDWDLELHDYFKITEKGFYKSSHNDPYEWKPAPNFMLLLTGQLELTKLPWKPKMFEEYYIPRISSIPDFCTKYHWLNDDYDRRCYDAGIVCKTKEEAVALTKKNAGGSRG